MQTDALTLLRSVGRGGEPRRQIAVTRPVHNDGSISEFDKTKSGGHADLTVGTGGGIRAILTASVWLAFYFMTAFHGLFAPGN